MILGLGAILMDKNDKNSRFWQNLQQVAGEMSNNHISATLWQKFGANSLLAIINQKKQKMLASGADWAIIIVNHAHHASQRCAPRWVFLWIK